MGRGENSGESSGTSRGNDHDSYELVAVTYIPEGMWSIKNYQVDSRYNGSAGTAAAADYSIQTKNILSSSYRALGQNIGKNTGEASLSATLDLRDGGLETGFFACRFKLQLPDLPMMPGTCGMAGFPLMQWGTTGVPGTITLSYMPVDAAGENPHTLVLRVTGDPLRYCTVRPRGAKYFIPVYLEYNGTDLLLAAGDSADSLTATDEIAVPSSPSTFRFGADVDNLFFSDLAIYNRVLGATVHAAATEFPYFVWDSDDSGVLAVVQTPDIPEDYFTFLDRGFTVGYSPAEFDLTSGQPLDSVTLFVNEEAITLTGFPGGTSSDFVTWLTSTNLGTVEFPFDGKLEKLKFVSTDANSFTAVHKRGSVLGQMSFALRFEGLSATDQIAGADWGRTVPLLGKIPQQFCLPHTGKVNEGISILGVNKQVTSPKAIRVQRRDDNIRTIGRVIGNIKNRPGSSPAYYICKPTSFFGSAQAPFPKKCIIYGNPNKLSTTLDSNSAYTYGLVWERYVQVEPSGVGMHQYPLNRSRVGDHFAGFSIDIPLGMTLRGFDINFAVMAAGLTGNGAGDVPGMCYDWGEGKRQFIQSLNGNADYTCIFYLMVALDAKGTIWRPIPSLGVDAVKVSGTNTWKDISFKAIDYESLVDVDGNSLLRGSRRTHFKMTLAAELSAVSYTGMSYQKKSSGKK